jgi:MraZ protein
MLDQWGSHIFFEKTMFRGLYEHSIDTKGRTSVPVRFRERLTDNVGEPGTLILTAGVDQCLVAYPVDQWEAFEQRLASLPQFDPAVVQLKRIYVAAAVEVAIDKHGRMMIPPMLREYAQLERDVVWAGMVTTLELWSKNKWAEQVTQSRSNPLAISDALARIGL